MKVLVHDYAGHPYAVQLSRAIARRGHTVLHVYSASNPMPQGSLAKAPGDADSLEIRPIHLQQKIDKAKFLKRREQEIEHGRLVGEVIHEFKPDVLISGSSPLDTQNHIWKVCAAVGTRPIFWLQDLTGVATELVLAKKLPGIGKPIGQYYTRMEERLLRQSAGVVAISSDFVDLLGQMGVAPDRVHLIENWGPLQEVPVRPKSNPWSIRNGLGSTFNFIYSGTLGMKHNPDLLLKLAQAFQSEPSVRVIVVTEGIGRRWLEEQKSALNLDRLLLFDFQPFAEVPDVMGASDVMAAILEPSAGVFSVPSKVLSYLCSGRPLLLAVPPQNLAARIVLGIEAGLVSDPTDSAAFIADARTLFADSDRRNRLGQNGRCYAEQTFDIEMIADRFIEVFEKCMS